MNSGVGGQDGGWDMFGQPNLWNSDSPLSGESRRSLIGGDNGSGLSDSSKNPSMWYSGYVPAQNVPATNTAQFHHQYSHPPASMGEDPLQSQASTLKMLLKGGRPSNIVAEEATRSSDHSGHELRVSSNNLATQPSPSVVSFFASAMNISGKEKTPENQQVPGKAKGKATDKGTDKRRVPNARSHPTRMEESAVANQGQYEVVSHRNVQNLNLPPSTTIGPTKAAVKATGNGTKHGRTERPHGKAEQQGDKEREREKEKDSASKQQLNPLAQDPTAEMDSVTAALWEQKNERARTRLISAMPSCPPLDTAYGSTISTDLWAHFQAVSPTREQLQSRAQNLYRLEGLVRSLYPRAALQLFGSSANGFGLASSDMDICLLLELNSNGNAQEEREEMGEIVESLGELFEEHSELEDVKPLPKARVPIVKFRDPVAGKECDICVNNHLALRNTELLWAYSQLDSRLQPLVFAIKHWAKRRAINDPYNGTLSSYAYVILAIHYLQTVQPPVLPNLQTYRKQYQRQRIINGFDCSFEERWSELKNFGARNKQSVGELLFGFYHLYADAFPYRGLVVCMRRGGYLCKLEKGWDRMTNRDRHLFCVEDPFEVSHDLGRLVDKNTIKYLQDEFRRAYRMMRSGRNWAEICEPWKKSNAPHGGKEPVTVTLANNPPVNKPEAPVTTTGHVHGHGQGQGHGVTVAPKEEGHNHKGGNHRGGHKHRKGGKPQ
jgi:DNA polymerase sigma